MRIAKRVQVMRKTMVIAVAAATAGMTGNAVAFDLAFESGWTGSLNTKLGVSSSWRAEAPESALIGSPANAVPMNGGVATDYSSGSGAQNIGNLNYQKGDRYSTVLKFLTELSLSNGDTALMVRAKGWYDQALKDEATPYGNRAAWTNGMGPNPLAGQRWDKPLSDAGAPTLSQFDGVYLLDAFISQDFNVGGQPAQVRAGRQATNWGEGLFFRGISQLSPLDVSALRRPGTELKEALLPTWSLTGNVGLPNGMSVDAFYQLKWEPTALEYCGTYWNMAHATLAPDPGACNVLDVLTGPNPLTLGTAATIPITQASGEKPKNSGHWGLSFRFPVEAIETEFALYAMNIASTTPNLSGKGFVFGPSHIIGSAATKFTPDMYPNLVLDYADNIKIYGLSAATNLWGVSFGAELSLQKDVPVGYFVKDLNAYLGVSTPLSPLRALQLGTLPTGTPFRFTGYELFDKKQLIINGVGTLGEVAQWFGATNGAIVGELGAEWNDLPDYRKPGALRYGTRISNYANYTLANGAPGPMVGPPATACTTPTGFSVLGCTNDGFATDFSWGYKLRGSLTYPQIFQSSWSASPSLFFAQDVKGVSMDGQLQEDRKTVALGLEFDLNKTHTINLGYTTYSGKWNVTRDHDNYTFAYTYSF